MLRKICLLCTCLVIAACSFGFGDSTAAGRIRISLLTCGTGDQAWETFGHTALRIVDSSAHGEQRDLVYNYGMFNGFDKDFEINFMKGKLPYFVGIETFREFMDEYLRYNRNVFEQELVMTVAQKLQLKNALDLNTLPQNCFYKYDFFFDNCSTRIRDIIPNTIGSSFKWGNAYPTPYGLSFRDIINQYFYYKHWTRIGVNILLGSKIDRKMTNLEIMFLPDFLSKGLAGAQVDGKPVAGQPITLIAGAPEPPTGTNGPVLVFWTIAIVTLCGLTIKPLVILGKIMTKLLLILTGLLGCFLLVMWFGTDHQTCANNFNLLWLLPTNLLLVFSKPKGRGKYALVCIALIFVTLILHVFKVQMVTIYELCPLFLALIFVYAGIYFRSIRVA